MVPRTHSAACPGRDREVQWSVTAHSFAITLPQPYHTPLLHGVVVSPRYGTCTTASLELPGHSTSVGIDGAPRSIKMGEV